MPVTARRMAIDSRAVRGYVLARRQLTGAVVVGTLAAALSLMRLLYAPRVTTDFDQWHYAARVLLGGQSPYDQIGPGRTFEWNWPLFYPLPAVILTTPLAWLSAGAGRVVFAAISGSVFGYAICRDGWFRLSTCLGAAFLIAVWTNQWSLLITSACFVPAAMIALAAKPNIGLAVASAISTSRQVRWLLLPAGVVALSLLIEPAWAGRWVAAVRTMEHGSAPLLHPGGFLLLLALWRWRRPEARLFVVLACVPQTASLYDLVPLFVVPRSLRSTTVLALLTHALFLAIVVTGPFASFNEYARQLGRLAVWFVWLPVLGMIMVRPNVWQEATAAHTPPTTGSSLRGRGLALSRADAWLLVLAGACTVLLTWVSLVTRARG
jgi:hypothetical protein